MNIYLKIKIKTLASEAADIRKQEKKLNIGARARKRIARNIELGSIYSSKTEERHSVNEHELARLQKKLARAKARSNNAYVTSAFWGLKNHRTNEVRKEARSSFIAYGFLRGVPYKAIEQTDMPVDVYRVQTLVAKFGTEDKRVLLQRLEEWFQA